MNKTTVSWRKFFSVAVSRILHNNPDAGWKDLRRIFKKSYPNVGKNSYRVKVWYDEAKMQYARRQEVPDYGPMFKEEDP